MLLNLDTHIVLRAFDGRLEPDERRILTENSAWGISAIVLWEIETLARKGRIVHGLGYEPLAAALGRLRVWPITADICRNLRRLDFASDPADELIAATSLTHGVPLLTRDSRIRTSRVIRCL